VGEIERGESNVTIQTLKIIADTLGVRIAELVKASRSSLLHYRRISRRLDFATCSFGQAVELPMQDARP
jgi:transcriptional regulator with XRE-family HTH domain